MYRHGAGSWAPWTSGIGAADSEINGLGFGGKTEGWAVDKNGHLFHYSGSNSAPTSSFTMSQNSATTLDTVSFDGSASSDADGDPMTYLWSWGDGTAGATTPTATHRYRNAGTYTVTLTVTDTQGTSSTSQKTIPVSYYALTNGADLTSSFTATGQKDYYTLSVPTAKNLLRLQLTVPNGANFNVYAKRGSIPTLASYDVAGVNGTGPEDARLASPQAGTWYVMVVSQSGSGSYTLRAGAYNAPSTPTATAGPQPVRVGNNLYLDGSSTSDVPISYTVYWGDGTSSSTPGAVNSGTAYSFVHTYQTVADYTATVTTTDTNGLSSSAQRTIQVRDFASGTTDAATNIQRNTARLRGTVTGLGGFTGIHAWFEHGTTTNYGSSTPTQVLTSTGAINADISGLSQNTVYHYRLVLDTALGTSYGTDRTFTTLPNVGPGTPTLAQTWDLTERSETFWVTGSVTDPEGDPIYYVVDWHDGTTSRYPASGTVASGTAYNLSHAYATYGTYNVSVYSSDQTPGAQPSPYNWVWHDVVDRPAGSTSAPTSVGRTSATFRGNVTSIGGDPAGAQVWFECGLRGGSYTQCTVPQAVTSAQSIAHAYSGLVEGAEYQVRLVLHNDWTSSRSSIVRTSPFFFVTNVAPVLRAMDPTQPEMDQDELATFMVRYFDSQNEAPAPGYPRVIVGTSTIVLQKLNPADSTYTNGVTYAANTTLPVGPNAYRYEVRDGWPVTLTFNGLYPSIKVNRTHHASEPIQHDPSAGGLPSQSWGASSTSDLVRWHTVANPNVPGLRDAPDGVSLWFGNDATLNYADGNAPVAGYVYTPWVNLADGRVHATRFWSYFDTEDNGTKYDTKKVFVEINEPTGGITKELLLTLSKPYDGNEKWWPVSASLSKYAGKEVRLRFEFDTLDGTANEYRGWYINQLVISRDMDVDGVPDAAEAQDKVTGAWKSTANLTVSPGGTVRGNVWGVSSTAAEGAVVVTELTMPRWQTTVALNTTTWSRTIFSAGMPTAGTTMWTPDGLSYLLFTNLSQVGWAMSTLDSPFNLTSRMTLFSSAPAGAWKLDTTRLLVDGHTPRKARDVDGDGLGDGAELGYAGTNPLTRDPENDGFEDRMDKRPFTPDDPPVISPICPLNTACPSDGQGWLNGIVFGVNSRHGVKDVKVFVTRTDGSTQQLSDIHHRKRGTDTWEWTYPAGAQVNSVFITANDSYYNNMGVTVNINPQGQPSSEQNMFRTFMKGVPIVLIVGTANTVAAGSALTGQVYITLGVLAAAGMLAVVVDHYAATPEAPAQTIATEFLYETGIMTAWPNAPGSAGLLGCTSTSTILLLQGLSDNTMYVRRGVNGIVADYPGDVAFGNQLLAKNHIGNVITGGQARYAQLDPYTASLFHIDGANKVVEQYTLHKGGAPCSLEIGRVYKWKYDDVKAIDELVGITGVAMFYNFLSTYIKTPEEYHYPEIFDVIHIRDGRNNMTEQRVLAKVVTPWEAFPVAIIRGIPARFSQPIDRVTTGVDMLTAQSAISTARILAGGILGNLNPAWYWNSGANQRAAREPLYSNLDNLTGVFHIDNAGGVAYNDLAAVSSGALLGLDILNPFGRRPVQDMLPESERDICTWMAAHPGAALAYIPMALQEVPGIQTHIWMDVAETPAQFSRGGCT